MDGCRDENKIVIVEGRLSIEYLRPLSVPGESRGSVTEKSM